MYYKYKGNIYNSETDSWNYTFTFSFEGKAQYLEFRKWWRFEYMELSNRIRAANLDIKQKMRAEAKETPLGEPIYYGTYREQGHHLNLKVKARMMMAMITQAKIESALQRSQELKIAV